MGVSARNRLLHPLPSALLPIRISPNLVLDLVPGDTAKSDSGDLLSNHSRRKRYVLERHRNLGCHAARQPKRIGRNLFSLAECEHAARNGGWVKPPDHTAIFTKVPAQYE